MLKKFRARAENNHERAEKAKKKKHLSYWRKNLYKKSNRSSHFVFLLIVYPFSNFVYKKKEKKTFAADEKEKKTQKLIFVHCNKTT